MPFYGGMQDLRDDLLYLNLFDKFCSYVTRFCRLVEGVPTDTAAVANHSCGHNSIMEVQAHSIN